MIFQTMDGKYVAVRWAGQPAVSAGEVCTTSAYVEREACHPPSMARCPCRESGGAQCELERGHRGRHGFEDALFSYLQFRERKLQGPICHTRLPVELVYEADAEPGL